MQDATKKEQMKEMQEYISMLKNGFKEVQDEIKDVQKEIDG